MCIMQARYYINIAAPRIVVNIVSSTPPSPFALYLAVFPRDARQRVMGELARCEASLSSIVFVVHIDLYEYFCVIF